MDAIKSGCFPCLELVDAVFSRFQHMINQNSITFGRVIQQHMSHRAHDFPILYNRAAAHE